MISSSCNNTYSLVLKNILTENMSTSPIHDHDHIWKRKKKIVRYELDRATIATCLTSLATHRPQFKMLEVFLPHPI